MTYQDIIDEINGKVENSTYSRFTIDQVLTDLNITYRDLANKTNIFETVRYLKLVNGAIKYTLPDDIYRPTRAMYRGKRIDFVSQEEMDNEIPLWETETSESELIYLVYNNMSDRLCKPYPRVKNIAVTAVASELEYIEEITDTTDTVNRYLFMNTNTGAKYLAPAVDSIPEDMYEVIEVYGAYLPPKVTTTDLTSTKIFIDEIKVNALIFGTAGNLLFNSGRTEDMAKGQNYLRIYGLDETEIGTIRKHDTNGKFRNTHRRAYRTPFDE